MYQKFHCLALHPALPSAWQRWWRRRNSSRRDEKEHVMKFVNVRLLTGDFSAAVTFWRDIMGLDMTYGDETMGYAYFDTGSSGVELLNRDAFTTTLGEATPAPAPQGHQAVLVF